MQNEKLKGHIRDVPGFPKPGIVFKDITTLLQNPDAFRETLQVLYERYKDKGIDVVAAIEARGFVIGGALAQMLGAGFVPVRKVGKLPYKTHKMEYELEYGTDTLEIHTDAIKKGQKVLVVDDLLATGGTLAATCKLVEMLGGEVVEAAVLIELSYLHGRDKLKGYDLFTMAVYESE
jgi:adenine phosphoribosyltransferase